MSLEKDIEQAYKEAFKDKREAEVSTLRMLRSALKNLSIDKRTETLTDEDVLSVIKKEIKKRKDSFDAFSKASRSDLADKEKAEMEILEKYMPEMLSEEQLDKIIDEIVSAGQNNFGLVMKEVMIKTKGQADGNLVQQKVKQKLNI